MADTSGNVTVYNVLWFPAGNPDRETFTPIQIIDGYTKFESIRRIIAIKYLSGDIDAVEIISVTRQMEG